jgi:energy-coupling factor transporter ATP-binding protein EcfA2
MPRWSWRPDFTFHRLSREFQLVLGDPSTKAVSRGQKQLIAVAVALTTQRDVKLLHREGASRQPPSGGQSRKLSEMQKGLRNR